MVSACIIGSITALSEDDGLKNSENQWSGNPNTYHLDTSTWNAFLHYKADLLNNSEDEQAQYMAAMGLDYINNEDPAYTSGELEKPDVRYFRIDFDGRKTESYYLVWLLDGWEEQEIKKGHN